jgi:hypothetical protein
MRIDLRRINRLLAYGVAIGWLDRAQSIVPSRNSFVDRRLDVSDCRAQRLDLRLCRHNRRKTKGVGRIAARVIESAAEKPPLTMPAIVDQMKPHRRFQAVQRAASA